MDARGKETKRTTKNYIEEDSGEKKERSRLGLLGSGASSIGWHRDMFSGLSLRAEGRGFPPATMNVFTS